MEELRDIKGLDHISMLPLAVGWWFVLGVMLCLLIVGLVYAYKLYRYKKSWQYQSYSVLNSIEIKLSREKNLPSKDFKHLVHELAIEIRRIAIAKHARENCAGLFGNQWLSWLQKNDPAEFDWPNNAQVLVNYQYMPDMDAIDKSKLMSLINAAKRWVNKC